MTNLLPIDIFQNVLVKLEMEDTLPTFKHYRVRSIQKLLLLTDIDLDEYIYNENVDFINIDKTMILEFIKYVKYQSTIHNVDDMEFYSNFELNDLYNHDFKTWCVDNCKPDIDVVHVSTKSEESPRNIIPYNNRRILSDFVHAKFPPIPISSTSMRTWKEHVLTIFSAHDCEKYLVHDVSNRPTCPTDCVSLQKYNDDLSWIHTALRTVTLKHVAHNIVLKAKDALEAWDSLITQFDKSGHDQGAISVATNQLTSVRLNSVNSGSFQYFVTYFESQCDILLREGTPISDLFKRELFLNNITHDKYQTLKIDLQLNSHDYNTCVHKCMLLSQYIEQEDTGSQSRTVNITKVGNSKPKILGHIVDMFGSVTSELYNSFDSNKKKEFCLERKRLRENGTYDYPPGWVPFKKRQEVKGNHKYHNPSTQDSQDSRSVDLLVNRIVSTLKLNSKSDQDSSLLPTNTSNRIHSNDCDSTLQTSCPDSVRNRMVNFLNKSQNTRNVNMTRTVSIGYNMRLVNHTKSMESFACILDSGADTTLAGSAFKFVEYTARTAHVIGFDKNLKIPNLKIGTCITSTEDINGQTVILMFNETIDHSSQPNTMISCLQCRHHGIDIDDVSQHHKRDGKPGCQNMIVDNHVIPFKPCHGLMTFSSRLPTPLEIKTCPIIEMTSDNPWDPDLLDETYTSVLDVPCDTNVISDNNILREHISKDISVLENQGSSDKTPSNLSVLGIMKSSCRPMYISRIQSKHDPPDIDLVQSKMGWLPKNVIEHTFSATTQLAKYGIRLPMRHHWKSPFPVLNRRRLHEKYCTDTWFSSTKSITGETCCQLFFGKKSKFCVVYGMVNESDGSSILQRFISDYGAPFTLHNDNSKMQTSIAWNKILNQYNILGTCTEPYNPQQNAAERQIQTIKSGVGRILDRSGAPNSLWLQCTIYYTMLRNVVAHTNLNWRTPTEVAFGITPDISPFLNFHFYERIFF